MSRVGPLLARVTGTDAWRQAEAHLIAGGKSNLTFGLTSEAGELILRRPPSGDLLATAHDMAREARVQRALAGTDVPVADIVLVDDGHTIGVPFYVMSKVDGHIVRDRLPPGYATTEAQRRALAFGLVDILAILHRVDADTVGLSDFGRPDGFAARQVRRWAAQWEASRFSPSPAVEGLGAALATSVPDDAGTGIVHGDFRIDNCVLASDDPGQVAAVLDWEMAALGDPMTDLGILLLYWREAGDREVRLVPTVTQLDGFPSRDELVGRYEQQGGHVNRLAWYRAFAHFKFAVITQGVAARSKAGAMGGQDLGPPDALVDEVEALADAGRELLQEDH